MNFDQDRNMGREKVAFSPSSSNSYSEISEALHFHKNDVAIVGMSCRTAGGVKSPEQLWQFLMAKGNGSGTIPTHRWEPWLRRDVRNMRELQQTISKGYFLEDLENFDASFFSISPKEAEQMDPHQRLGLELAWEALENAGIDPNRLAGSNTAVYMGCDSDDYSRLLLEDIPNIEPWMGIGTAAHGIPNRISYHLNLMGPSAAIDAACASSLVAIHLGYKAIQNGESHVAIVGGVNVLVGPALTCVLGKAGALSPEGICRSFDDDANGYARGEGGAVVILKDMAMALADGDNVLAVMKGSAVAQDGKTNGIMAPNAKSQELVGRLALQRACLNPLSVDYIEAHATSTTLGDPTEISALAALYGSGAGRNQQYPALIGSIKPNVGHLEAAAGAIGFIKTVLAVKKGQLAPQIQLVKLNSRVDWDDSGLQVVRTAVPWPVYKTSRLRTAAVCCYGYGGTVAHAIIQQPPGTYTPPSPQEFVRRNLPGPIILPLSSPQYKRLATRSIQLAEWLSCSPCVPVHLREIANTLALRRAHHDHRAAIVIDTQQECVEALQALAEDACDGKDHIAQGCVLGPPKSRSTEIVWVFSGHGAQWKAMGAELLQNHVFMSMILELDGMVQTEAGFSAVQALQSGDFETVDRVQVLTYIIQIGLYRVLVHEGVEPQAVIGHSVGEVAASVAAGCLNAEEGLLVVARRAKLYIDLRCKVEGAMALVQLPYAEMGQELEGREDVVVAIDSSPSTCVISGDASSVLNVVQQLETRGIKAFRVNTDVAFHSPMLEQYWESLNKTLNESIHPRAPSTKIYSTSASDPRTSALRNIEYWQNNMVRPVMLQSAVAAALDDGYRIFMEISAHPIIAHSVHETISERGLDETCFLVTPTMKREVGVMKSLRSAIARLYTVGAQIEWEKQSWDGETWCKEVPLTPWLHKPFYKQVESPPAMHPHMHDVEKHILLGPRTDISGTDITIFTTKLNDKLKPYPGLHPLDGTEIIPAGVYINTFHHATGATVLTDMQLRIPISIGPEIREVQVILEGCNMRIASNAERSTLEMPEQPWILHSLVQWASSAQQDCSTPETVDIQSIQKRIGTLLPNSFATDYLGKIGVEGIAFPWEVTEHYGNSSEMMVRVDMDPSKSKPDWDERSLAPMFDAATSVGSAIFFEDETFKLVSGIDRVNIFTTQPMPKIGYLFIQQASDAKGLAAHITILDTQGLILAKITSMRFSEIDGAQGVSRTVDSLVHRMTWVPPNFVERPRPLNRVILVAADQKRYIHQIQAESSDVLHVGSAEDLQNRADEVTSVLSRTGGTVIFAPEDVEDVDKVPAAAARFIWNASGIVKFMARRSIGKDCKFFIVTKGVRVGESATGLAHGPLHGLARIIGSEHPDIWGGLTDIEPHDDRMPLLSLKYVKGHDVLTMVDSLPRRPLLRPLTRDWLHKPETAKTLLPNPGGAYLITGGLGDLALETCNFLSQKGARRIVLVSRRCLPPRSQWDKLQVANDTRWVRIIQRIQRLEGQGVTIHSVSLDVSEPDASERLLVTLQDLNLPPVRGVIHAAGLLGGSMLLETTQEQYRDVFAPKVDGAVALHKAFPPGSLDFFIMYSSIGQLVGTDGQAAYASSNAFLDALVTYRRKAGDHAFSFQFTAWKEIGMVADRASGEEELSSKGITAISSSEAFQAWEHVNKYDIESAVVTRITPIEQVETVACPLFEDVVVRKSTAVQENKEKLANDKASSSCVSGSKEERRMHLTLKIRECIAATLMSDVKDIDVHTPLSGFGMDSVMNVSLRQKFQKTFNLKVPASLTWNFPTVDHLAGWFLENLS